MCSKMIGKDLFLTFNYKFFKHLLLDPMTLYTFLIDFSFYTKICGYQIVCAHGVI